MGLPACVQGYRTALHEAAVEGREDAVRVLLDHGALESARRCLLRCGRGVGGEGEGAARAA